MNTDRKQTLHWIGQQLILIFGGDEPEDFKEGCQPYPEGKLLKEIRTYLEIQQKDIAEEIGITASALSGHEKRNIVNDKIIQAYLYFFGISSDKLRAIETALSVLDTDLKGLLNSFNENVKEMQRLKAEQQSSNKQRYINDIVAWLLKMPMSKLKDIYKYVYTMYFFNQYDLDLDDFSTDLTDEQKSELVIKRIEESYKIRRNKRTAQDQKEGES